MRRKVVEEKGAEALVGLIMGADGDGANNAVSRSTAILVEAAWCLRLLTEDLVTRRKVRMGMCIAHIWCHQK